jgi:hypothetical protein
MNLETDIHTLTTQELAQFGLSYLAYVKPVVVDDQPLYAIHAADGRQMAVMPDRATAVAALLQHDLEAMSVH